MKIVSVHVPKTGGSSFHRTLTETFGRKAVLDDYDDDPVDPCSPYSLDPEGCRRRAKAAGCPPGIEVVHGHFHPSKYDWLTSAKRIVFLRHPVDNIISIYYYWQSLKGEQFRGAHALFRYARRNRLSLLEVAHLPAFRYLLSRTFFGGVDLSRFDFIGFAETYAEDLRAVARLLSIPLVETRANANTYPGYRDLASSIKADERMMAALHDCLADDIRFYEEVRKRRGSALLQAADLLPDRRHCSILP